MTQRSQNKTLLMVTATTVALLVAPCLASAQISNQVVNQAPKKFSDLVAQKNKSAVQKDVSRGGNTSGGGGPNTVNIGALKLMLEGQGLKNAMINYVQTIQLGLVEDPIVRNSLTGIGKSNLIDDIQKSQYVTATPAAPCKDAFSHGVPASALIGQPGTAICFDVAKIAPLYASFNEEETMVKLASLAFHEHMHHFQKTPAKKDAKSIDEIETQANRVAGYVMITAKFVQLPLLKWTKPTGNGSGFADIEALYTQIKAKEQAFIAPAEIDYQGYQDYRGQNDRGVIRILPRETYDGKMSIQGGGAYYSFARLTHDYGYGSDIELDNNKLGVGFAGCDYGYILDLGDTALSSVDENTPGLQYLFDYITPSLNEPEVRKAQYDARELILNGFDYTSRKEARLGHTYVVRSISFGDSDMLVAFKLLRKGADGSYSLAWRKLKTFPVSACSAPEKSR